MSLLQVHPRFDMRGSLSAAAFLSALFHFALKQMTDRHKGVDGDHLCNDAFFAAWLGFRIARSGSCGKRMKYARLRHKEAALIRHSSAWTLQTLRSCDSRAGMRWRRPRREDEA